jgi:hypothetical protein
LINVLEHPVNKFSISIFLKKSIFVGINKTFELLKIPFRLQSLFPQLNKFLFSKKIKNLKLKIKI